MDIGEAKDKIINHFEEIIDQQLDNIATSQNICLEADYTPLPVEYIFGFINGFEFVSQVKIPEYWHSIIVAKIKEFERQGLEEIRKTLEDQNE